jgi:hypothetical protein
MYEESRQPAVDGEALKVLDLKSAAPRVRRKMRAVPEGDVGDSHTLAAPADAAGAWTN